MRFEALLETANPRVVIWSARILALAAAVQFVAMVGGMWNLAGEDAAVLPRFDGWELSFPVMIAIFTGWVAGAAALASRRWILRAGWMLPVSLVLAMSLDEQIGGGHLYLVAVGSALLVAREWTERRPATRRVAPVLLWAFQAQISIVLFWAAIGKINPLFVSGGVLRASLGSSVVSLPDWAVGQTALHMMALAVIGLELFIAFGLWMPRFRWLALSLAVVLHVGIVLLMIPTLVLLAFGLAMAAGYVLFLPKRETVAA